MRYVIENTEAFRILANRARERELAQAATLAAEQVGRIVKNPARRHNALIGLGAFVIGCIALRMLLPAAARVEVAAGLMLFGTLALPWIVLREIMLRGQPAARHSQP